MPETKSGTEALAAAQAENKRMREALSFYADETRYRGPNQTLDEPDEWSDSVGLKAYRLDVTRDFGTIARAALSTPADTSEIDRLVADAEQARSKADRMKCLLDESRDEADRLRAALIEISIDCPNAEYADVARTAITAKIGEVE